MGIWTAGLRCRPPRPLRALNISIIAVHFIAFTARHRICCAMIAVWARNRFLPSERTLLWWRPSFCVLDCCFAYAQICWLHVCASIGQTCVQTVTVGISRTRGSQMTDIATALERATLVYIVHLNIHWDEWSSGLIDSLVWTDSHQSALRCVKLLSGIITHTVRNLLYYTRLFEIDVQCFLCVKSSNR